MKFQKPKHRSTSHLSDTNTSSLHQPKDLLSDVPSDTDDESEEEARRALIEALKSASCSLAQFWTTTCEVRNPRNTAPFPNFARNFNSTGREWLRYETREEDLSKSMNRFALLILSKITRGDIYKNLSILVTASCLLLYSALCSFISNVLSVNQHDETFSNSIHIRDHRIIRRITTFFNRKRRLRRLAKGCSNSMHASDHRNIHHPPVHCFHRLILCIRLCICLNPETHFIKSNPRNQMAPRFNRSLRICSRFWAK